MSKILIIDDDKAFCDVTVMMLRKLGHEAVAINSLKNISSLVLQIAPDIILLDISGVGTEHGYNKKLLEEFEDMKEKLIIAGGLNKDSLGELESLGIKKVLIGTSLHSGEVNLLD